MSANTETEAFYREVDDKHLVPLWNITESQLTTEPQSPVKAHLWRWADLRRLAHQAGDLVPIERGGERRVLGLVNPGLGGKPAATRTLWAAVQIVKPGEIAPCHRHSPSAIRFIIEGDRTYTNLNGDKCVMSRGDLVLTPNWDWHDHGCESDEPMIWMDGLDLPLVGDLDATFFEMYPDHRFPITDINESERKFGVTHLRPTWEKPPENRSPLLNFKWEPTYDALQRIGEGPASAHDDVCFEYLNPSTGGPVLPTMSCTIQMVRPGVRTQAHRQVQSSVYLAFSGKGYSVINGERLDWEQGDFFVVPPWAWHEHANDTDGESILFAIHDAPVMKALGLYREESYTEGDGHQEITASFEA